MKCINKFIFSALFLLFIIPFSAGATSGACSYHDGVDCSMGRQSSGKVYCNDGWTDSMVAYDFMIMCQNNNQDLDKIIYNQLYYDGKIV